MHLNTSLRQEVILKLYQHKTINSTAVGALPNINNQGEQLGITSLKLAQNDSKGKSNLQ